MQEDQRLQDSIDISDTVSKSPSTEDKIFKQATLYVDSGIKYWYIPAGVFVGAVLVGFLSHLVVGIGFVLMMLIMHILFFALTIALLLYVVALFITRKESDGLSRISIAMVLVVMSAVFWVAFGAFFAARGERLPSGDGVSQPLAVRIKDVETDRWKDLSTLTGLSTPMELQFDSRATVPAQTPWYRVVSYAWDLDGNGEFTEQEGDKSVATYFYTDKGVKNGLFEVSLRITKEILEPHGEYKQVGEIVEETYGPGSSSGGLTFQVDIERPVIDVKTLPSTLRGTVPFEVEFDARRTQSPNDIDEITWDFDGDKLPDATGDQVSYTFVKPDIYKVIVTATDVEGLSSKKVIEIEVADTLLPEPVLITSTLSGEAPLKVKFNGSESKSDEGEIIEYLWEIEGISTPLRGKEAEYIFKEPGKYRVTLKVKTDTGVTAEASELITVTVSKSKPSARIKATGRSGTKQLNAVQGGRITGSVPLTLDFDGSFSTDPDKDIVSFGWDFQGKGSVDKSGESASYTFKQAGSYTVKLTVEDSVGNKDQAELFVVVTSEDFSVNISANRLSGPAPMSVAFDASGSSYANGEILSYTWDFGDGSPVKLTGAKAEHTYNQPGEYVTSVKVTTSDNATKTAKQVVTALDPSLLPVFSMTPNRGGAPATISFNASESDGDIVSYKWDFGNGKIGTGSKTSHTYSVAGTYVVVLTITDSTGAVKRLEKQLSID